MFDQRHTKRIAATALTCLALSAACAQVAPEGSETGSSTQDLTGKELSSERIKRTRLSKYSGEELYRGLYLGDGPAADAIPEIRDNLKLSLFVGNAKQREAVRAAYDQIIVEMRELSPDFFEGFRKAILSRDPVTIQEAFKEAAVLTQDTVESIPEMAEHIVKARQEIDKGRLEQLEPKVLEEIKHNGGKDIGDPPALGVVFGAVAFVVVHNVAVVTALGYVVVATEAWVGSDLRDSRILTESIVLSIANAP